MLFCCSFSGGIQFAAAQLPLLQLIDCGMPILDPCSRDDASDAKGMLTDKNELGHGYYPKPPVVKLQSICQKLIIKHSRLKKLSLWGCSGLDVCFPYLKPLGSYSLFGVGLSVWLKCRHYT